MKNVIGVRFQEVGKVYYFDPGKVIVKSGEGVIVETVKGIEFGWVVMDPHEVEEKRIVKPLKTIMRKADKKDYEKLEKNKTREAEIFDICLEKIIKHKLDMKLSVVECAFDGNKIIFYFTADGRVDFRELVKDLAAVFKTRIELRQIGVRDEAKMIGGLGPCGRPCCCSQFLGGFAPVSIKMAKEQNLSLSPTKISGLCGRLMCCLGYENEHYKCTRKLMPKVGSKILTKDGEAVVLAANCLTEQIKTKLVLPDETVEIKTYKLSDIQKVSEVNSVDDEELEIDDEIRSLLDE